MMDRSFGEYKCIVSVNDTAKEHAAMFRIGKLRPNYARIVYCLDILTSKCYVKQVDISEVKSWMDFVHICNQIANDHDLVIRRCLWSFSYRF